MTTYTHRNGETEPPTIVGAYGFRGLYMDIRPDAYGTHEVAGIITLYHPDRETWPEFIAYDCETGEGAYHNAKDFDGKWWGPITGPWGEQ